MNESLIPDDALTREQLAKVLAEMIKEDFEKARAGGNGSEPTPTSADTDADQNDRNQGYSTPAAVNKQTEVRDD